MFIGSCRGLRTSTKHKGTKPGRQALRKPSCLRTSTKHKGTKHVINGVDIIGSLRTSTKHKGTKLFSAVASSNPV